MTRFDGMNLSTAEPQVGLSAQSVCTDHCWSRHTEEFGAVQDGQASLG